MVKNSETFLLRPLLVAVAWWGNERPSNRAKKTGKFDPRITTLKITGGNATKTKTKN